MRETNFAKKQVNVEISGDEAQVLTMSGLDGAIAPADAVSNCQRNCLRLDHPVDSYYHAHGFFVLDGLDRYAAFDGTRLFLQMKPGMTFKLNRVYTFQFTFTNPAQGQDSPNITFAGSGTATFLPTAMQKSSDVNGNAAPLLVADFTRKTISQSTPSQGFQNTLTITLASRASLLAQDNSRTVVSERPATTVVITGLSGAATISGSLPITGSGTSVFGSNGAWYRDASGGKLVLTVLNDTVAYKEYVLQIVLENPTDGQVAYPLHHLHRIWTAPLTRIAPFRRAPLS